MEIQLNNNYTNGVSRADKRLADALKTNGLVVNLMLATSLFCIKCILLSSFDKYNLSHTSQHNLLRLDKSIQLYQFHYGNQ